MLSDLDRTMLACEREWWTRPGSKEQAIRDVFDWTPTAYYARLNRLIDQPEALAHDPVTVGRLRRLRDDRGRRRQRLRSSA